MHDTSLQLTSFFHFWLLWICPPPKKKLLFPGLPRTTSPMPRVTEANWPSAVCIWRGQVLGIDFPGVLRPQKGHHPLPNHPVFQVLSVLVNQGNDLPLPFWQVIHFTFSFFF